MKIYVVFAIVLVSSNVAWSEEAVEYCSSLLSVKDVEQICSRSEVKVKDGNMPGFELPCNLSYSSPKTDVPLREGQLSLSENSKLSSISEAAEWVKYARPDGASDVSAVADGS